MASKGNCLSVSVNMISQVFPHFRINTMFVYKWKHRISKENLQISRYSYSKGIIKIDRHFAKVEKAFIIF